MEELYLASYMWNSNELSKSSKWTKEENKLFESALAMYDEKRPHRWFEVAAMIPGKSVHDVIKQYRALEADVTDIEAGLVPDPGYLSSSFTLELMENRGIDVFRKRGRSSEQERKKGVPWTQEEHKRFLLGLMKHGKGDWRNISRNFVISKTPTQVASHAQKYYLRQQLSGVKDKKRPSIHDITTINVTNITLPDNQKSTPSPWNHSSDDPSIIFGSAHGNRFTGNSYGAAPRWNFRADTGITNPGYQF